jgi:hypothetical protein
MQSPSYPSSSKSRNLSLMRLIIARHWQRDASRRASRLAAIKQAAPKQIVDCLQHRPSELICHPAAFGHALFDRIDPPIPLLGIIIPRFHDGDIGSHA